MLNEISNYRQPRLLDYERLEAEVKKRFKREEIEMVISGGAAGADLLSQEFCKKHGLPILIYYPDWDRLGKSAGFARNTKIVEAADIVLAFHHLKSRGTQDSIDKALGLKKKVIVIEV